VGAAWDLLVGTSLEVRHDPLVSHAIQFLAAVVQRPQYRALFDSDASLKNVCERIGKSPLLLARSRPVREEAILSFMSIQYQCSLHDQF
jgi:hypothetical protein